MPAPRRTGDANLIVAAVCGGASLLLMYPLGVFFFYSFLLIALTSAAGIGFGIAAVGQRHRGWRKAVAILALVGSALSLVGLLAVLVGWSVLPLLGGSRSPIAS